MDEICRTLVRHATDALSWHDLRGMFRYVSPGFTQLLGYGEGDVAGLSVADLVHPEDVESLASAHRNLLTDGGTFRLTFRMRRSDHTYLWVESSGRVLVTDGGLEGIVAVTRDIEIRRSLLETLEYEQRLRDHLAQVADQQQHFVTTVAHRTRTPMTAVLGFAQTLHRSGHRLSAEQRDHLVARLAANAEALAEVIEDATVLDQIGNDPHTVQWTECDLEELVADAVAQLADPEAPIRRDLSPEARTVRGDPVKLDRALRAMLRNAIAHTPRHTVITIRTRRTPEGIRLTVEDRGPGIRDELKEAVFEPFAKGDVHLPHDPGLGLGLHLVARIAAEHGGRAWVTDVTGGGAAFHLLVADLKR